MHLRSRGLRVAAVDEVLVCISIRVALTISVEYETKPEDLATWSFFDFISSRVR
jgi:hypothetical protein